MFCMRCQNELADCICSDIDERLASLGYHPNLAFRICAKCNLHYARCKCKLSVWEVSKAWWQKFIGRN